jgi:hypothetical protein
MGQACQNEKNPDKRGQMRTNPDKRGQMRTNADKHGQIRTTSFLVIAHLPQALQVKRRQVWNKKVFEGLQLFCVHS